MRRRPSPAAWRPTRAFRDAVLLMAGCGGNVDWAMRFIAAPLAFEGEVKAMLVKAFKNRNQTNSLAHLVDDALVRSTHAAELV